MAVYSNSALVPHMLPGLSHRTLAGAEHGLKGLEIWSESLDAMAATPAHRHDCEEVVIIVAGQGKVTISGSKMNFSAGDTIIIPRYAIHQIFNIGESVLRVFSALNMAPVRTESPSGVRIDLPWQQAASATEAALPSYMSRNAARHAPISKQWSLHTWLLQCFLATFGRQNTQRQRLALFELEERELRDIGLSREQALDEARKAFWK